MDKSELPKLVQGFSHPPSGRFVLSSRSVHACWSLGCGCSRLTKKGNKHRKKSEQQDENKENRRKRKGTNREKKDGNNREAIGNGTGNNRGITRIQEGSNRKE